MLEWSITINCNQDSDNTRVGYVIDADFPVPLIDILGALERIKFLLQMEEDAEVEFIPFEDEDEEEGEDDGEETSSR